jgi:hypothetical protein
MTAAIRFWPGTRTLLTGPAQTNLDLTAAVGQRQATFRFALTDGVTGENLGDIHPIRQPANLSHDTMSTTKRRLTLSLGKADLAEINQIRDRISPFMVFPGIGEYPLGRYMFTVPQAQLYARQQRIGVLELNDEMFLVDQQISEGINGLNLAVTGLLTEILTPLPIQFAAEASPYLSAQSWGLGTTRGQILESLALIGDYWSPWFDNNGVLQFVRTVDPAKRVPDIDLDLGGRVYQASIVETTDLLTAPNRFIVVSNAAVEDSTTAGPMVGIADVPPAAPHSIPNRGFEIPKQINMQLTSSRQAQAVADGLVQRQTVFETVNVATALDPRHDGYNVIRFDGSNWLELAWGMQMVDGGEMTHTMRKGYAA